MTCRTYNPSVRVGNWNEDIQLEEDTLKDFMEKREKGELLIQRSGNLSQSVNAKANLSISRDGCAHFGDTVMLVNPAAKDQTKYSTGDAPRQASCLSVSGSCSVSGSSNMASCARNTFVIISTQGEANGDRLTYNTPFYLCAAQGGLFLNSDHVSFTKSSKKSRHQAVGLVPEPSKLCAWKVLPLDPQTRVEQEFSPVPANCKLIMTHVHTNRNLVVEQDFKLKSPFGLEYEIAAHNYLDSHKAEKEVHHFIIQTGEPPAPETSSNPPSQDSQRPC